MMIISLRILMLLHPRTQSIFKNLIYLLISMRSAIEFSLVRSDFAWLDFWCWIYVAENFAIWNIWYAWECADLEFAWLAFCCWISVVENFANWNIWYVW